MEYSKILETFGFKRMDINWNETPISDKIEKWHLYLRYTLIVDGNSFHIIDYKGDSYGPCHNIKDLSKIINEFKDVDDMIREYREYQLNKII